MRSSILLYGFVFLLLTACQPIQFFDDTPAITFVSIEPLQVREAEDSIVIIFNFTDGDGDLGLEASDTTNDVTILDQRKGPPEIGDIEYPYRLPFVTPPGQSKQISGEVRIVIQNTFRRPGLQTDTLSYSIQIRDRANRFSNIIQTDKIVVVGNN